MNPRQRRGALLLVLAVIGAGLSFVSLTSYVAEVQSRVGGMTTALVLDYDVDAYEPVPAGSVSVVEVPRRWLPDTALHSTSELAGQVASSDLRAGSFLQRGMLTQPPAVKPGELEVALTLKPDSVPPGVRRNSQVHILASFSDRRCGKPGTWVVVSGARVLDRRPAGRDNENVRLLLALSVQDSLALNCATGSGSNITVSLVSPRSSPLPSASRRYQGPPKKASPKPSGSARPSGSTQK